ncbi:hypothetical protein Tco_1326548 [Tanacetum coccineum]
MLTLRVQRGPEIIGYKDRKKLDFRGPIPRKTPSKGIEAIKEILGHSFSWHDEYIMKNVGADNRDEVKEPDAQRKEVEFYVPPIPFLEALEKMPKYAKFMKDHLTNKAKFKETSKVTLNERCSAVLLNKIPLKENDPGALRSHVLLVE